MSHPIVFPHAPGAGGAVAHAPSDLEIRDAQLIFHTVWQSLEAEHGRENLHFPKELILLGGAPGSGKGTNTEFIMKLRDLTCAPIVMSALLDSPEARRIKDAGSMVGDREVVGILFRKLLEKPFRNGALIDGFPRTKVQVETLKLLYEEMSKLRDDFDGTPHAKFFRKPVFHIVVLFVEERESVLRQVKRGREILEHNARVRITGQGTLLEERITDTNEEAARKRYKVFKEQTYDALESLKRIFHYHLVNAMGPVEEVQAAIVREFSYQSSLELDPLTFDRIRKLPLATEIVRNARQELVRRLDSYEAEDAALFREVVVFVGRKIMPIVVRHATSGQANVNSEDPLLERHGALAMIIDVLTERGYHPVVDIHRQEIPQSVDLATGEIRVRMKKVYRFIIRFRGSNIRRGVV